MPPNKKHGKMKIITVNVPKLYLKYIQRLLDKGIWPSRSEYVRWAVGNQITRDLERQEKLEDLLRAGPAITVKVPEGWDYIEGFNGNKPFKTRVIEKEMDY